MEDGYKSAHLGKKSGDVPRNPLFFGIKLREVPKTRMEKEVRVEDGTPCPLV